MRKLIVATVLSAFSAFAFAQASGGAAAGKVDIKGNTTNIGIAGEQTAVAVGENNTAKNTAGAIKGGTTIKGNTTNIGIAGKQTAVAVGKGNTAENAVGQIGGK